ncbi:MAG: glutathione S-transferase family protein [Kiloniellaceae bacterium]|nr:glutathione S-transferase family protein [Kiloniellaceae bacterium]
MKPVLFGPSYSVYVRIAKITLLEKGVDFDQVAFDVFDHNDWPADWPQRQPFGLVPAFEHDGFRLYETRAITRYLDEAFPGPHLQPDDPRGRARMEQVISVLDGQGYRPMVWDIYVERVSRGKTGESDEAAIAAALPKAERRLAALAEILGNQTYLAGADFSLADAQAAPIFDYFVQAGEGRDLLRAQPALAAWWDRLSARPSVRAACAGEAA